MPSCTVRVRNATSPVPVKKVRVTFRFSDGTSDTNSSGNIHLKKGQSVSVGSDSSAKCVKQTRTVVTVGSSQIPKTDGVSPGLCQKVLGWRVDAKGISPEFAPEAEGLEAPESVWPELEGFIELNPDPDVDEEVPEDTPE